MSELPGQPMSRDEERVLESFDYHKPSDEQVDRIAAVRRTCKGAAERLLRCLHEAMMNANKAIVCEDSRRTPP
jgi:hypothetical protein